MNNSAKHMNPRTLIEYRCHDCMGEYGDGLGDCRKPTCPLYEYMPYRTLPVERPYLAWSPRRPERQPKRKVTLERIELTKAAFKAARNKRSTVLGPKDTRLEEDNSPRTIEEPQGGIGRS